MMRYLIFAPMLLAVLGACSTTAPNDGEAYLDKTTPDPAALERKSEEDRLKQAETGTVTVELPVDTAPEKAVAPTGDTTVTVDLSGTAATDVGKTPTSDGSISKSQDFQVVKANETIASDAAKLEELKSNYEIVQPETAPTRGSDINLAKYALAQSNPVGQKIYTRFSIGSKRVKRKCAVFISDDEAQTAFLKNGGPQKDRRGIDPDGDGYACGWSPAVYRALIGQ